MFNKIDSKKNLFITTILSTLTFFILAHGYRFTNPLFSGDSLLMIHQTDSAWEIALGRFVQPILVFLRGGLTNPFLISILSTFWIALSAYYIVDLFDFKRVISVVFVTAVMTCNSTVLVTSSSFISYADFYCFALFCSVLGVWLLKKGKLPYIVLGILAFVVSLGTYQAYISVAIALVMIHFLLNITDFLTFKDMIKQGMKYVIPFIIAALLYLITWKLFQIIFGIWTANTYNGLSSVGDFSDISIWSVIAKTYGNVFDYFFYPETFTTVPFRGISLSIFWTYIIRLFNAATLIVLVWSFIKKNLVSKTTWWQRIVQLLILLLLPMGLNFVCLISKGTEHTIMIYAFCLVYILAIRIAESDTTQATDASTLQKSCIPWFAVLVFVAVLSWSNIVFSNQVYLKRDLQEQATLSLMTRIVYSIESTEGYVPGVTPVALSGSFENTPSIPEMEAFKDVRPYGMGKSSLTYVGTDYAFLTHFMNVNMNLTRINGDLEAVKQMPVYPAKGSVAFVDGILVVKIAN